MKAIIWDFLNTIYDPSEKNLYPSTKELLEKFHTRYKQVLASTTYNVEGRKKLIKSFGIWDHFDRIDIGLKSKKLFLDICNEFNCKPHEVYVIGDNALNEIRTGNKLNMKTIWIDKKGKSALKERLLRIKYWKKVKKLSELEDILN